MLNVYLLYAELGMKSADNIITLRIYWIYL